MSDESRERADARLTEAFARAGVADTRPAYRQRLRALRGADPQAFERALRHYEEVVLPALDGGEADAVETWIAYGGWLAELTGQGRLVAIDASGRSAAYAAPAAADALVLHVPADAGTPVLAARVPASPTPAQRATYDLLVDGRLELAG